MTNIESVIHLECTIPNESNHLRLDQALAQLFPDYSRSQLQQWIKLGYVCINKKCCTSPKEKVHVDQTIEINAQLLKKESWDAQPIPLHIVYEDEDLIVINKPVGLVVHPGAGNYDQTLVNALLHHDATLAHVPRAGLIHRLDKNTSGLLIIARTLTTHQALVSALQLRKITREYEAVVQGVMRSGGTIDAPIGRHRIHRTHMSVTASGKKAITHYRVIERFRAHTHVRLKLETGRTHQIRVHLAHINYPIVGDPVYGKQPIFPPQPLCELKEAISNFKRQALHACHLELMHPTKNILMSWQAPLPEDMMMLLQSLRNDNNSR